MPHRSSDIFCIDDGAEEAGTPVPLLVPVPAKPEKKPDFIEVGRNEERRNSGEMSVEIIDPKQRREKSGRFITETFQ